ncbi:MAG TPA: HIT domain-containing protein, partial [Candidatus Woesearchaeota archaeon]|nr:HIT domain-containing protein [Candidatus Woesearchaeota archaeon]
QLEEQKKNCIFCKIIKGEIESKKVYSDDIILGILDINPCVKGHMLLLPKEHYPILPYLPPETFRHMFGVMPKIIGALKKAMITTGANVFIANGGVAGQQSPHFLIHLLPREKGDGVDNFAFDERKDIDKTKQEQATGMLAHNIPAMMRNHFMRNPVKWLTKTPKTADYLKDIKEKQKVIYEDNKVLVVIPENPQCTGHVEIFSNEEESQFENLSAESATHMFSTASYCATAVFEGLGAHGSNIILKTGQSQDNADGRLSIHVLPRFQDDGLDLLCKPMEPKPNLDEIASRIRDEMFMVEYSLKEKKKPEVIDLDKNVIDLSKKKKNSPEEPKEEIDEAIKKIKGDI